ncbi:MAG: hypothetical protein ACXWI6_22150 [Burkholderiales bacterium]
MQIPAKTYSTAEDVASDRDELTALRHRIHQHPELSHKEVETARLVAEKLRTALRDLDAKLRSAQAHAKAA